ncbi:TetR/AcrR family transcriptional regulator [Microbacterium hominis]|uniref:TetR/AcrR family transcriptional regulator n=1 Tax=Microbacterium hominis TaxID=162426 RepID=A0A7D4Q6L0_9MICO|nr:TetR/AcrR family transcriptional regulator [Microbacterium hominis]QKJ18319.1 TetR/AcrR family transcriptional regulator [Microbacterium hominis]
MPKISEARRQQRRAQILDAALRCFRRVGYQRTSMADIIAESGLSAGAIYGYFDSKEELLKAVAEAILDDRQTVLETAAHTAGLTPAAIVRILASGVREQAPIEVLVQVWGEATVDPDLRAMMQVVLGRVRGTIIAVLRQWARGNADQLRVDPDAWAAATAPVLMGLIPGFVVQLALVDGFDADAYLAALDDALPFR